MIVSKIAIKNILGIEAMDINPGSVTEVAGSNGAGKTSVLEAIRAALSGGHDATLLRSGAEKGEIVLVLDDGTEIQKTIDAAKSKTVVKHPLYGKLPKPAEFIRRLADALALNPVSFLTAPKKDRTDQFLQAIPIKITADQVGFVPTEALRGVDLDKHALEAISAIHKNIFDLRTGVNRAEKEKRATASQMTETLPPDAPEGESWSDALTAATTELQALTRETGERVRALDAEAEAVKTAALQKFQDHSSRVKAELADAIEKLRADSEIEIVRAREESAAVIDAAEASRRAKREHLEAEFRPSDAALKEKIGHAKAMVEQQTKAASTKEFIAKMDSEADALKEQSAKLTAALSRLEVLKAGLLETLPIPGLSVQDGDIYIGDIPFDRVNTARKVQVAIEVAKLRAGELGLIACDGLELLDAKTFDAFKKAAAKSNVQFVISRVAEGPLTVSTEEVA